MGMCRNMHKYNNEECPFCSEKKFGEIAVQVMNILKQEDLNRAKKAQREWDNDNEKSKLLGTILVEKGLLVPVQVKEVLAHQGIKTMLLCAKCKLFYNLYGTELTEFHPSCPSCQSFPLTPQDTNTILAEEYQYGGYLPREDTHDSSNTSVPAQEEQKPQAASSSPSCRIGEIFAARYEIRQELGQGAMGIVYRAFDKKLEREVALKILHPKANTPEKIERFGQEAKIIARFKHENIVQVLDCDTKPFLYYTMEYLQGVTLSRKGKLDPNQAAVIFEKVAQALQYAHEKGVIHRDIKPSNIMLNEKEQPKIMDFGLAKILSSPLPEDSSAVLGTPNYASPEQAAGESVDARTDIYALGATLYQAITGKPPFEGDWSSGVAQISSQPPLPPRKLNADIPEALENLCLKCLAQDPQERYSSAKEVAEELERIARKNSSQEPHVADNSKIHVEQDIDILTDGGKVTAVKTGEWIPAQTRQKIWKVEKGSEVVGYEMGSFPKKKN
ncbi:MAG: serine/threonine protein kinase [Candidatus Brocadiae bacterium]|nr:serine/threonine protein kinase [Candidatus Brocadiia bacterium]